VNRTWASVVLLFVAGCEKPPAPPTAPVDVPAVPQLPTVASPPAGNDSLGLVDKPLSFKGDTPGVMTEKECEQKFPRAEWKVESEKVHRAMIDDVKTLADQPIDRLSYVFFDGILSSIDVQMAGSKRLDVEDVFVATFGKPNEDGEWRHGTTRLKRGVFIRYYDVEVEKRREAYEAAAKKAATEKSAKDL
jgi:hypothetical protein